MKYGIIQPTYALTNNSGVMVQCKMWAEGLRKLLLFIGNAKSQKGRLAYGNLPESGE